MAVRLVMSYHGDTLLTCSQDLHADNIVFSLPGLAELTTQVWMHTLEDPDLIPVIPRNFEDQSDSLPKYLVEAADITNVVQSVMSKHGTEGIYAVVIDFGSGETQIKSFWLIQRMGLVHFYSIPCIGSYTGTTYTALHLRTRSTYPNDVSQRRILLS